MENLAAAINAAIREEALLLGLDPQFENLPFFWGCEAEHPQESPAFGWGDVIGEIIVPGAAMPRRLTIGAWMPPELIEAAAMAAIYLHLKG